MEILATLSEQDINQALYFQKNLFRIEQLTILFATQEILHWFRVIRFYVTM